MSLRLDLPTVILLYNTSLVAGALSLHQLSLHSCRPNGLRSIVAALLMLAIGSALAWNGEHASLPDWMWTHVTLALGAFGYTLFWAGVREFSGRKAVPWNLALLPAIGCLLLGLVTDFPQTNLLRAGAFHLAAIFALTLGAVEVLRDHKIEPLPSRKLLGLFLGLSAGVYVLQLALIVTGDAGPVSFSWAFYVQMFCHFGIALVVSAIANERAEIRLALAALTDPLTGVGNRRWMDSRLPREMPANSAILQLDIDKFKQINDQFGHPIGDRVLVEFAHCLRAQLRNTDLLARMGGEEFVIYLPSVSWSDATVISERLRSSVQALRIKEADVAVPVTVSIGVAWVGDPQMHAGHCLKVADDSLYQAKAAGRNRVVMVALAQVAETNAVEAAVPYASM